MERTKMTNFRNGSKGAFEPEFTRLRVRRSTTPRSNGGHIYHYLIRRHELTAREEEESKVEREMAGQCGSWYEGEGAGGDEVNDRAT